MGCRNNISGSIHNDGGEVRLDSNRLEYCRAINLNGGRLLRHRDSSGFGHGAHGHTNVRYAIPSGRDLPGARDFDVQLGDDFRSKVVYHGRDSIIYDLEGNRGLLYGNAEITYEDINLKAAYIEIKYNSNPEPSGIISIPVKAGLRISLPGRVKTTSMAIP